MPAATTSFGVFENMRKIEAGGEFNKQYGSALRPEDGGDPEIFKVRRGKVGGWRDYLDEGDA